MKKRRPALLIAPAVLLVAGIAGYLMLLRPKQAEVAKLDDKIASLETQIQAADLAISREDQASASESAIRVADLVRLAKAMPDDPDIAQTLVELNEAALASGVKFVAIQPQTETLLAGYRRFPISLTFQGSYYDLTQLLFRLRNLVTVRDGVLDATGRLFTLDSLDLHEGKDGFPEVEAILIVSAYAYGGTPVGSPAAGGAAAPATGAATGTGGTATGTATTETTGTAGTTTTSPADASVDAAQAAAGASG